MAETVRGPGEPDADSTISIEIAYADARMQFVRRLGVARGSTVEQVIHSAHALAALPAGFQAASVGIFGEAVSPQRVVVEGDRIEWYRPLIIDPKQARRLRTTKPTKR